MRKLKVDTEPMLPKLNKAILLLTFMLVGNCYAQLAGYHFYKTITIQSSQVAGSVAHSNFPILINEIDGDLATVGNGGKVQSIYGYDIAFTAADGSTLLDHQIERYDPTDGNFQAWVKIPTLSTSTNTEIRMYYGNGSISSDPSTTNVWDANFAAVYHLTDDFIDKTANNNDFTNFGTSNNGSGKIAKCRNFSTSDYMTAPSHSSIALSGDVTLSTWIHPDVIQTVDPLDNALIGIGGVGDILDGNHLYYLNINADSTISMLWEYGILGTDVVVTSSAPVTFPGSGYTFITATRDVATNTVTFYQDGLQLGTPQTYTTDPSTGLLSFIELRLGTNQQFTNLDFDGDQDEVRVSNIVRSADWILTDFNTINDPSTFYSKGPQTESCDPSFTYTDLQYCEGAALMPVPTISGDAGGTFSSTPAGLSLNPSTGQIDVSTSSVGSYAVTYTITACVYDSTLTIDIVAVDDPSYFYLSPTYCTNDADPTAIITGTPGGTFSGPAQLSLNTSTGQIDLSASTPGGPYTIKYVTPGPLCKDSATFDITIFDAAEAAFNYTAGQFCLDGTVESPTITGLAGGNFTAAPAGIVVDFSSGDLNLGTSNSGLYDVYYNSPNGCVDTFALNLIDLDDGSFTYPQPSYCHEASDPTPTITGTTGGTFSEPSGNLSLNPSTGTIDLSTSTPGATYTISYTTPGPDCPVTETFNLTIIAMGDPSFNYAQTTFCEYDSDPVANITGSNGGTFTEPTSTLTLNASDGTIDVSAGPTGMYWIVYTTPGLCQKSDSVQITINPDDDGSFSYSQILYCMDETDPIPSISGTTGGTFSEPTGNLTLNTSTGEIDLSASTPDATYTITYTTPGPNCPVSETFDVTITSLEDASFTYLSNNYCQDEVNQFPTVTGVAGGSFTTTSSIALLNGTTGEVDIMASPVGGPYTIYYTTPGPICPNVDSFDISIGLVEDPSFSYLQTDYCVNETNPVPTIDGTTGGVFTANSSVNINSSDGTIDLLASTPGGPYAITYTTPGPACLRDSIFFITIWSMDDPSFQYSSNNYCELDPNQLPTLTGMSGGNWSISPAGLTIDAANGELNISNGLTNTTFTIQYVTNGQCIDSTTFDVTIDDSVTADAGPDQILNIQNETQLEAIDPAIGSGQWSVSNDAQITNELDPYSNINNLPSGETTCYWTVSNGVCPSATDTMRIQVNDLAVPDVITPNGDGFNDAYVVPGIENKISTIEILNRWGQTVFKQENYQNDWEGTDMNGELLPDDTYFFIITIEDESNQSGFIVIKT